MGGGRGDRGTLLVGAILLAAGVGAVPAAAQDPAPPPPRQKLNIRIHERFRGEKPRHHYGQPLSVRVDTPSGPLAIDSTCEWIPGEKRIAAVPASPPVGPVTLTLAGSPFEIEIPDPQWLPPDVLDPPYYSTPPTTGGGPIEVPGDGADRGLFTGPDVDLELGRSVTDWISPDLTAHVYARGLFGELDLAGVDTDVRLISAGARFRTTLLDAGAVRLSAHVSAGPGWLHASDLGEATGIDAAAGVGGELRVTEAVHLTVGTEAHGFWSEDLRGWGPALLFGFNLGW